MEDGWLIYKVAYPGANGTTSELLKFMTHHSGGSACEAVNLGCDGYKITCNYGKAKKGQNPDKQIHYVVAPRLESEAVKHDGMGVDGWIAKWTDSYGDMSTFNVFMHEKMQLYTADVVSKYSELSNAGFSIMRRSSIASDGVTLMGHVMVAVGGKIWDFVGPLSEESTDYPLWSDEECPMAHRVEANVRLLKDVSNATNSSWISVGVVSSDVNSDDMTVMLGHLTDMTGALRSDFSNDYCDVVSISYDDMWENQNGGDVGEDIVVKYVHNKKLTSLADGTTVKEYEEYVALTNKKLLHGTADGDPEHRWRAWSHWQDLHIGVMYPGSQETCLTMAAEVNEALLDDKIYASKRFIQHDGDHYYVAYPANPMTIEYNTECHYGSAGTTDICTCVPQNSDYHAIATYGAKMSSCDIIYLDNDGHAELTGPWDSTKSDDPKPARK